MERSNDGRQEVDLKKLVSKQELRGLSQSQTIQSLECH